jgi:outer membrane protein OmpA-like peptidoglycan-associated protein
MRSRLRFRLLIFVASLLSGPAFAQTAPRDRSFSPQLFHPAPGPDEFITVEPAAPLHHLGLDLGVFFNYGRNVFTIYNYDPVKKEVTSLRAVPISSLLAADVWFGIGLWDRLQIAIALPMALYQTGDDFTDPNLSTPVKTSTGFAFGDPRLHLKVRLYGHDRGPQVSLSHWLGFPVGQDDKFGGEKNFTGFSGEGRLLLGWESVRWRTGIFVGFNWRAHESMFFSTAVGQQITYGGAFAYDVLPRRFALVAELFGRHDFTSDINVSPLELDIAGKVRLSHGISLNLGVGNGLIAGLGSPQPRVFAGLVWQPESRDRDHDGVPDADDLCPDVPEDRDGFKDDDGCPDPDNDGDTILDKDDKCPNEAEDFDQFEDEDGCPDPDNDKDGIDDLHDACPLDPEDHKPPKPNDGCPLSKTDTDGDGIVDSKDKCPTEPEDKDGFQDDDGCPDPDNDNDGIPDNFDQCPNEPEDIDQFQDEDGCPDPDNDKDGIPDKQDKCPNEPETINGYQDEDGCPDKGPPPKVKIEAGQIKILEKVFFDTNKATIQPKSFNLLDQVALVIKSHPEFKIRVEGHTDSQGNFDHNTKLSQERADSVRTYLIKKNVEPERLISAGYGPAQPIADNKTKAGREANRRVEFHIVEEPTKKKAPPQQEPPPAE